MAIVIAAGGTALAADDDRPADVKAIQALNAAFVKAFAAGDAKAVAALFAEDGEVAEATSGGTVNGRAAIAAHFAAAFTADPGATIQIEPETLRFLGPDAARETGRSVVTPTGGGTPEPGRYLAIFVRRGGHWLHDSVVELPDADSPAPTAHDRLADLAWLVGEWVDESGHGVVHTTCKWTEDGNFLTREFTMRVAGIPASGGTQRIGWDARAGQFASWEFDADGGHSTGVWNRSADGAWIIKATGVLADGRPVSATQVLTPVDRSTARWRSIDRTIGGEAVADSPEIVLVRKPPKAAGSIPAPSTTRKP